MFLQDKRYNDYNSYLKTLFPQRIQKISINAGFSCPNRNGEKGWGGCTYCNNQTFNPEYCFRGESITDQIKKGIKFFRKKYPTQEYFAYFQAYTSTYDTYENLVKRYEEALAFDGVKGLIIGTRPDCVNDTLLDYLAELSKKYYIMVEYGVESTNDNTLKFINRGHDFATCVEAIQETAKRGIKTGVHMILGLPTESHDDIMEHAAKLSVLPINSLKLHQLQLVKGTIMAKQYQEDPTIFNFFTADEYIDLIIDFLENLNPNIPIERFTSQSPKELLIAPDWGLKNFEFVHKIEKQLALRDTFQGKKWKG